MVDTVEVVEDMVEVVEVDNTPVATALQSIKTPQDTPPRPHQATPLHTPPPPQGVTPLHTHRHHHQGATLLHTHPPHHQGVTPLHTHPPRQATLLLPTPALDTIRSEVCQPRLHPLTRALAGESLINFSLSSQQSAVF